MPVGCSPSLPVAAALWPEPLALEPADASAPVAAGPGEDGRGGWSCCGPQLTLSLVPHQLHHVHWVIPLPYEVGIVIGSGLSHEEIKVQRDEVIPCPGLENSQQESRQTPVCLVPEAVLGTTASCHCVKIPFPPFLSAASLSFPYPPPVPAPHLTRCP